MSNRRFLSALLLLACVLGERNAEAEGLSTFEYLAFEDFAIGLCSTNEPSRAGEFAKLRNPPYTCQPADPAAMEQGRQSDEYKEFSKKLARDLKDLSKKQVKELCQSLLDARC